MKGRKPKPTRLKILHGEKNQNRINTNEPIPSSDIGDHPPEYLSQNAKKEWKEIAGELKSLGLLTQIDKTGLSAYCEAYARWLDAEELIRKHGLLIQAPKSGVIMHNPAISIANKSMEIMHKFMTEFGMTPSSRTRISVKFQEAKSEMEQICSHL